MGPATDLLCEPGQSVSLSHTQERVGVMGTALSVCPAHHCLTSLCSLSACAPVPGPRLHRLSCPGGTGQGRSDRDVQVRGGRGQKSAWHRCTCRQLVEPARAVGTCLQGSTVPTTGLTPLPFHQHLGARPAGTSGTLLGARSQGRARPWGSRGSPHTQMPAES